MSRQSQCFHDLRIRLPPVFSHRCTLNERPRHHDGWRRYARSASTQDASSQGDTEDSLRRKRRTEWKRRQQASLSSLLLTDVL